ncbi:SpoIIE family protein phosphatase [Desulfobotulus sp. H1]|uniref:SpoIIE family protein phosphatase n=1 Tax=Desulfobotulus pelophilus TaxID=2823377 RepID=A0ABT3N7Z6_9BACT|nr:SpoIIE family protein phosphatase [Desulfobotulus pelophilus]MCW7753578.1 SpoIIE family protein phosphatase [Desulfobotulus pelophilus]
MARTASLSIRILLYFLLLAMIITLASTILMVAQDHQQEQKAMHQTLDQIGYTYVHTISALVWNMGSEEIFLVADGIHNIPGVVHVKVEDEKKQRLAEKGEETEGTTRIYPLYQLEGLIPSTIGTLFVTMDTVAMNQRIRTNGLRILAIRAVDLMIISLAFLWIIRHLITRRLETMAVYTRNMNLDGLETPLILQKTTGSQDTDELDTVAGAINIMRLSILQGLEQKAEKARMEGEIRAAAAIQGALLPQSPPLIFSTDAAFAFEPALEVSGDYFDFFPLDEFRMGVVIADASGKGIPAAMIVSAARVLIMAYPELQSRPDALLCAMNRTLPSAMGASQFLTLTYFVVDTRENRITLVSAGHDPVLLKRGSGEILSLKPHGYPFCRLHQKTFDTRLKSLRLSIEPGDTLLAFTDGVTETLSPENEAFGENRIRSLMKQNHSSPEDLIRSIRNQLEHFRNNRIPLDDATLVALHFHPRHP